MTEHSPNLGHRRQVTTQEAENHDHDAPHAVSLGILFGVFAMLIFLTYLTVAVTSWDFGTTLNLTIALSIAIVKGALVMLFFMHLWWDSPFNTLAIIAAIGFTMLFIGIAITDTSHYKKNIRPADAQTPPKYYQPLM